MFSKKIFSLLALGMACAWQPASAQTKQQASFLVHVEANIPSEQFSVVPAGWQNAEPWTLGYDQGKNRFKGVTKQITVTSNLGDVSARLMHMAILSNQRSSIPLVISVADKVLTMQPQTVAPGTTVRAATLPLSIEPGDHASDALISGDYYGAVSMLFEANPAANH